jgi:hypothetical protein
MIEAPMPAPDFVYGVSGAAQTTSPGIGTVNSGGKLNLDLTL